MKAKAWLPVACGSIAGGIYAFYRLGATTKSLPQCVARVIGSLMQTINAALWQDDRGNGVMLLFYFVLVILFWAAVGAGVGSIVALCVRLAKRKVG
jgi:hypothetical protein